MQLYHNYAKYFVEPIPELAEELRRNVAHVPNATVIVAAVLDMHLTPRKVPMYCLDPQQASEFTVHHFWANQICSFDKGHVLKHFPGAKTVTVNVDGFNVADLLQHFSINDVQVLLVDTEGFDYHVLQQLPFDDPSFKPLLIAYEYKHLSQTHQRNAKKLLHHRGYIIAFDADNGYAVLR